MTTSDEAASQSSSGPGPRLQPRLDHFHELGCGLREHRDAGIERSHGVGVRARLDRPDRPDDPHTVVHRRAHGGSCPRLDDTDDRDIEGLLREREPHGGRGVACDDHELDRMLREPRAYLEHEATDLVGFARPVRAAGGVAQVDDVLLGQSTDDLTCDRQAPEAGIEDPDGKVIHTGQYTRATLPRAVHSPHATPSRHLHREQSARRRRRRPPSGRPPRRGAPGRCHDRLHAPARRRDGRAGRRGLSSHLRRCRATGLPSRPYGRTCPPTLRTPTPTRSTRQACSRSQTRSMARYPTRRSCRVAGPEMGHAEGLSETAEAASLEAASVIRSLLASCGLGARPALSTA